MTHDNGMTYTQVRVLRDRARKTGHNDIADRFNAVLDYFQRRTAQEPEDPRLVAEDFLDKRNQ